MRKKFLILMFASVLCVFSACSSDKDILTGTTWEDGIGYEHHFESGGQYKEYMADKNEMIRRSSEAGTYTVYTDKKTVSEYEEKYNLCQDELKKRFESETDEGKKIVLILNVEDNPSQKNTATGKQTHFEYYGQISDNKLVLVEPSLYNYDDVLVLTSKDSKKDPDTEIKTRLEKAGLQKSDAKEAAKILEDLGVTGITDVENLCTNENTVLEITDIDNIKYILKFDDKNKLVTITGAPPKGGLLYSLKEQGS